MRPKNLPKPRYIQWHALLELSANTFTASLLILEIFTVFSAIRKKSPEAHKTKVRKKFTSPANLYIEKSEVESCCSYLFGMSHSFRNKTLRNKKG